MVLMQKKNRQIQVPDHDVANMEALGYKIVVLDGREQPAEGGMGNSKRTPGGTAAGGGKSGGGSH